MTAASQQDAANSPPRRRLRRLKAGALSAVALGLALLAGLCGWWLNDAIGDDPPATAAAVTVSRPVTVVADPVAVSSTVPNVLGLDVDSAREVLLDAGIDPSAVTAVATPFAGQSGLVVDQDPAPGAEPSGSVRLSVSAAASVPALVDEGVEKARELLSTLGARVVVRPRFVAGADEGTVIATEPASGRPLPSDVVVVVAEAPASVFLTRLQPITSGCGPQAVNVGGTVYAESIVCSLSGETVQVAEYALSRRAVELTAVLGHTDQTVGTEEVFYRVLVDGAPLRRGVLRFGGSVKIRVPLRGALRVALETRVERPPASPEQTTLAWADVQLLGGERAIAALADPGP